MSSLLTRLLPRAVARGAWSPTAASSLRTSSTSTRGARQLHSFDSTAGAHGGQGNDSRGRRGAWGARFTLPIASTAAAVVVVWAGTSVPRTEAQAGAQEQVEVAEGAAQEGAEEAPSGAGAPAPGDNAVVTQDEAYMEGIKLYGIGIKDDPVPGEKRGKGMQVRGKRDASEREREREKERGVEWSRMLTGCAHV